jgi:hypothetical protein
VDKVLTRQELAHWRLIYQRSEQYRRFYQEAAMHAERGFHKWLEAQLSLRAALPKETA